MITDRRTRTSTGSIYYGREFFETLNMPPQRDERLSVLLAWGVALVLAALFGSR